MIKSPTAMKKLQLGLQLRNARLDLFESLVGPSPILELRSGVMPANCSAATTGILLAHTALPRAWMQRAKDGRKEKNGNWILTGAAGLAPTAIGYFRIYRFGAPDECHLQGEVTLTGQGGVMTVDNLVIGAGQKANVTRFVLVDGNA